MKFGWTAVLIALGLIAVPAAAKEPHPLFASDAPLHLTITGAIASLSRGEPTANKSVPATVRVDGAAPETLAATLSPRGITRREKDVCSFVPIRIEFTGKPPAGSLFKGQKKLKLVVHCRPAEAFQQYLLLEFAAYRMYQQLTPVSFGVRLATIDYVDDRGKPMTTRLGFLVEDADDVAKRNSLAKFKGERIGSAALAPAAAARFTAFEYLIGNLDWAMTAGPAGTDCCHNSKLLGSEGAAAGLTPVPYDFDFAGLVDAPYATSPAAIPLPNVRVRRYRGYCRHNAEAPAAFAELVAKRAALVGVLDTIPHLEARARDKASGYLAGGFETVSTPAGVIKLLSGCVG